MDLLVNLNSNYWLLNFISNNWLIVSIVVAILWPFIPPEKFGYSAFLPDPVTGALMPAARLNLLRVLLKSLLQGPIEILISMMSFFGFQQMIGLIVFVVIGFDVLSRKQLSREAITLVSIGLVGLYLEQMSHQAQKLTLFWKVIEWESKETTSNLPNSVPPPLSIPVNPPKLEDQNIVSGKKNKTAAIS